MTTTKFKYYSLSKVLSYNAVFNFIVGARGNGKTYAAKKKVIKDALTKGHEFIYLRRYSTELGAKETFFSDIDWEFPAYVFRVNGNVAQAAKADARKKEWVTIGYFVQLSNAQAKKSVAYPKVRTIIFDEFIIETGLLRYLPSEVTAFMDFYSTVDRWKDKTRVLFISNSISLTNPYFLEYNIKPDQVGEYSTHYDGFIACHFIDAAEFSAAVYQTRFGKFIKGTEYGKYSAEAEFKDGHVRLIGNRPEDSIFWFNIATKLGSFSVWQSRLSDTFYVQEYCPPEQKEYTTEPTMVTEDRHLLVYSDTFMSVLRTAFRRGRMIFDGPRARNSFIETFKK